MKGQGVEVFQQRSWHTGRICGKKVKLVQRIKRHASESDRQLKMEIKIECKELL